MPDEMPQPSTAEFETSSAPKDLRTELETDLKSEFASNLSAAGILPKLTCDSLVTLLATSGPLSTDVIAALALEDSTQQEFPNE